MHPEPERVVQLFVEKPALVGSGYLVGPGLVLTAAHLLVDGGPCRIIAGIPPAPKREYIVNADDATPDVDADISVLRVDPELGSAPLSRFGRVRRGAGQVEAEAIGFPRWKLRDREDDRSPYRDVYTAFGTVSALDNAREDTLEFTTRATPERDPDRGRSAWEGMSGAAVWVRGSIVGVVTEHHAAEGMSMLACRPLTAIRNPIVGGALGLSENGRQLADVGPIDPYKEILDLHRRQCLEKCPRDEAGFPRLEGREEELSVIAEFCAGDGQHLWIQGPPWAGKTALAAAFVLDPPQGVTTLAVFVSGRMTGEGFLDACLRPLGAMLRRAVEGLPTTAEKQAMLELLLEEVGVTLGQFVLVVDGLDEDPHLPGTPWIAQLLPQSLPPGTKLIVTSRPTPSAVLGNHPVTAAAPMVLEPSSVARDVAQSAAAELDAVFRNPPPGAIELLGLMAVTDGLAAEEVAELLEPAQPSGHIRLLLEERVGRVFTVLDSLDERQYAFAHAELLAAARNFFGARELTHIEARIDRWVDAYAQQGWPDDTPAFCLGRYLDLLRQRGNYPRLATMVLDRGRRQRLFTKTGNHVTATAQVVTALQATSSSPEPDIASATRLAITAFILRRHLAETAFPEMVTFLVLTGRSRAAIDALGTVSPDEFRWESMVASLAAALYLTRADREADEVLESAQARVGPRLLATAGRSCAAARPDVALRLLRESGVGADPELLASLAGHKAYIETAVELAGYDLEARLAVASALASRDPESALSMCAAEGSFEEWSGGDKQRRTSAFARVEVARLIPSDDLAVSVLRGELGGDDGPAALVSMAARLARHDSVEARKLVDTHTPAGKALREIANIAIAAGAGQETSMAFTSVPWWLPRDLDVVDRFGAELAVASAPYHELLRMLVDGRATPPDVERPEMAVEVVATELACIGALTDRDVADLQKRFGVKETGEAYNAFGAAARRVAHVDPTQAVAFARKSGVSRTWVLRDVVAAVAPNDPARALAIIDGVEAKYTATRSILLGVVGASISPSDSTTLAEISRRLPRPEEGEAVNSALADCALRLAGLLPAPDSRADELVARFGSHASPKALDRFSADRAVILASANPDEAVRLLKTIELTSVASVRVGADASRRIAGLLPTELALEALTHFVFSPFIGDALEGILAALGRIDPPMALRLMVARQTSPEILAHVLTSATDAAVDRPATVEALELSAPEILRDLKDRSADDSIALSAIWAVARLGGVAPGDLAARSGRLDLAPMLDAIANGGQAQLMALIEAGGEEPAILDDVVAMSVVELRTRGAEAMASALIRLVEGDSKMPGGRVARLVDIVARTDPEVALSAIDEIAWRLDSNVPDISRDLALERAVAHLAPGNWHVAFDRARTIGDSNCLHNALAHVAGAIPRGWLPPKRAAALRQVISVAMERLVGWDDFVGSLMEELRERDTVDRWMQVELLVATAAWPTDSGVWRLGEALALIATDPAGVSEAVEGLLATVEDLTQ